MADPQGADPHRLPRPSCRVATTWCSSPTSSRHLSAARSLSRSTCVEPSTRSCSTPSSSSHRRGLGRRRQRHPQRRRGDLDEATERGHSDARPRRSSPGAATLHTSLPRASSTTSSTASTAARSPTPTAPSTSSPPPSSRPPHARRALPVLGRARVQGGLRASRSSCADGLAAISNAAEIVARPTGDGRRARPLRRHDADVDLPRGVRRRAARGHRAGRRRRHAAARSCTRPASGHLTAFALDVGAFALRYFADYYGIPYPGDKLDLVAIPDFSFGAMENLGCVTFRETLLLVDPERGHPGRAASASPT